MRRVIVGVVLAALAVTVTAQGPARIIPAIFPILGPNGIATTSTDGLSLVNSTAATAGVQVQYSPRLRFSGTAWKSNATAASQQNQFMCELRPVAGAAASTFTVVCGGAAAGAGSFTDLWSISSAGNLTLAGNATVLSQLTATADANLNLGNETRGGVIRVQAAGNVGHLIPTIGANTQDLGDATNTWRTGYFGTNVSTAALATTGAVTHANTAGAAAGDIPLCLSTGNVVHTAAMTCGVSAARFKQNVEPLTGLGLAEVLKMRPVTFELKTEYQRRGAKRQLGFIADDLAALDPQLVTRDDEGRVLNYDDRALMATLIQAVQEQQAVISALQQQVRRLQQSIGSTR